MYLLASKSDTTEPTENAANQPSPRPTHEQNLARAAKAWLRASRVWDRANEKNNPNDWGFDPDKDWDAQNALVDAGAEFISWIEEAGKEAPECNYHELNAFAAKVLG